jgi:hypothetical protein
MKKASRGSQCWMMAKAGAGRRSDPKRKPITQGSPRVKRDRTPALGIDGSPCVKQ